MVDERGEREPIEVELLDTDLAGRADLVRAVDTSGAAHAASRGRVVAVAAVVGVVGLVVGVVIGRGAGGDDVAVDDAPTAGRTDVTPDTAAVSVLEELPAPSPRTASPPTTTDLGEASPRPTIIDVAPRARSLPIDLVAISQRGELLRVDAATGNLRTADVSGAQFGPPLVHVGDGWSLIPSAVSERPSMVHRDDGTVTPLGDDAAWPVIRQTGTDRFWLGRAPRVDDESFVFVEVSVSDGETGRRIEVPAVARLADPRGGLLVDAPGGSYVISPDGTERLSPGRVVALGAETALAVECDAVLACGHVVIDRATGDRRPLQLDRAFGDRTTVQVESWESDGAFDERETRLLVTTWDQLGRGERSTGILDLSTGAYTPIVAGVEVPRLQWAPGDAHVFWLHRGIVEVYDVERAASTVFSPDLGTVTTFALRTRLPSVDGLPRAP